MARDEILKKYLHICGLAATDDTVFCRFKSIKAYTEVLEHCSHKLGLAHWFNIEWDYFSHEDKMHFLNNDRYGGPAKFQFHKYIASPTTIQYISVLSNLITRFGSLVGFTICELGGGYGGQAKIIKDKFQVKYDIIDLPECTLLQEKYLSMLNQSEDVQLYTNENYPVKEYDLFVSNYAITEVSPSDQLKYVQDVCLNSKRGYITANQPLNGLDLLKEKFNVTISPDIKGERDTNHLITWG